jgi:hypothetical protein
MVDDHYNHYSDRCCSHLFDGPLRRSDVISEGNAMTSARMISLASAALAACYFPAAFYCQSSFSDDEPAGSQPLTLYSTKIQNTRAAAMWLPTEIDRVAIYQDGKKIANANIVVDHPDRNFSADGKRWKVVEFNVRDVKGKYYGLGLPPDRSLRSDLRQ